MKFNRLAIGATRNYWRELPRDKNTCGLPAPSRLFDEIVVRTMVLDNKANHSTIPFIDLHLFLIRRTGKDFANKIALVF